MRTASSPSRPTRTTGRASPRSSTSCSRRPPASDKLSGVASDDAATFDITDPNFNVQCVEDIKGYNSNGELTGDVITTFSVDNLGYGYIGICAENICMNGDPGSEASRTCRKGFATLFPVYRDTVVNSYYGETAKIIQYPITNTSWAARAPTRATRPLSPSMGRQSDLHRRMTGAGALRRRPPGRHRLLQGRRPELGRGLRQVRRLSRCSV